MCGARMAAGGVAAANRGQGPTRGSACAAPPRSVSLFGMPGLVRDWRRTTKGKYQLNYLFNNHTKRTARERRKTAGDLLAGRRVYAQRASNRQRYNGRSQNGSSHWLSYPLSGTVATYIVYVPALASHSRVATHVSRDVRRIGVGDAATVPVRLLSIEYNCSTTETFPMYTSRATSTTMCIQYIPQELRQHRDINTQREPGYQHTDRQKHT